MSLRYKCLVLDHDDTAVISTPHIHYPSFVEALKVLRPDKADLSLDDFILNSFSPGFSEFCTDILCMTEEEINYQYEIWRGYTQTMVPDFYPGFPELLFDYKKAGGIITVVSHSEKEQIERDYKEKCGIIPDMIFGWEKEAEKRKPNPYPILEIMKKYKLNPSDILVVDDLKPGLTMAKNCNVEFAAVGWSHSIETIQKYMKENSNYYFSSVKELRDFIFA